jgi:hypothetical protein
MIGCEGVMVTGSDKLLDQSFFFLLFRLIVIDDYR